MEGQKDNQDPPPRPLARHLSDADRLRKVIQELMDTEKSYVKVKKNKKIKEVWLSAALLLRLTMTCGWS